MAVELATAYVNLVGSARGLGKDVVDKFGAVGDEAGDKAGKGLVSRLGSIAKTGALAVGAAAGGVLATALFKGWNRLTNIENAESKLAGLGHSAESVKTIMDSALDSVRGTAYGLDTAATVAASTVAAGIKPGEELTRVLTLVGDAATIGGSSMEEMGAIFNKVAASNKLSMREINQLAIQGIPIQQFLAAEFGVTAGEISKMVSRGEVDFETFAKAMETNLGGAALESGSTTQGAFANMNAALGRFGATLLKGVFPLAKEVFGGITRIVDNLGDKVGPQMAKVSGAIVEAWSVLARGDFTGDGPWEEDSPVVAGLFAFREGLSLTVGTVSELWNIMAKGDFTGSGPWQEDSPVVDALFTIREGLDLTGGAVQEFWGILARGDFTGTGPWQEDSPVVDALFNMREGAAGLASEMGGKFQSAWAAVTPIMSEVGGVLGPALVSVWETLKPAISAVLPAITQLLPLLNPVGLVFRALLPILPQIAEVIGQIATVFAEVLAQALAVVIPIITSLVEVFSGLMPVIADLVSDFLPILMDIIQELVPVIGDIVAALAPFVATLVEAIAPILPVIAEVLGEVATALGGALLGAVKAIMPLVQSVLSLFQSLLPPFQRLISSLLPPLIGLFQKVAPAIQAILGSLVPLIEQIVSFLIPAIESLLPVFEVVFETIGELIGAFIDIVGGIIDFITGVFTGDWSAAWDGVLAIFGGLWDAVTGLVEGALEFLGAFFSGLWSNITTWVGDLAGKFLNWGMDLLAKLVSGIGTGAIALGEWFLALPGKILGWLAQLFIDAVTWGGNIIADMLRGLGVGALDLLVWFIELPGRIAGWIADLFVKAWNWGVDLVKAIFNGIVNAPYNLGKALNDKLAGSWLAPSKPNFPTAQDLLKLPGNADGGPIPRGLSLVGEEGPELVWWGSGAPQVISNPDSARLLATATPAGSSGRSGPVVGQINVQPGMNPFAVAAEVDRAATFRGGYGFGN